MVRGVEIGEIGRVMSVLAISISATEGSGVLMIANHGVGYAGWPKGDRGIELLGPLQGLIFPAFCWNDRGTCPLCRQPWGACLDASSFVSGNQY